MEIVTNNQPRKIRKRKGRHEVEYDGQVYDLVGGVFTLPANSVFPGWHAYRQEDAGRVVLFRWTDDGQVVCGHCQRP